MKSIYHSCQGESHLADNKPCQDSSYAESSPELSMAIVSDGHGGERYFRSHFGSKFAVEETAEAIREFVKVTNPEIFKSEFTAHSEVSSSDLSLNDRAYESFRRLFASIIFKWNLRIDEHARNTDLTEWESSNVDLKYKDEFLRNRDNVDSSFEKTYGCTLMAFVKTPDYWFAFQIGDGKLVVMHEKENEISCLQPVPWDEKCFLNRTTSICDSSALSEFRFCYQGNGEFPIGAFLGSDGMDDSYGDGDNLHNFYIELYKLFIKKGDKHTLKELEVSLPQISKFGSKDDMSVAALFSDSDPVSIFVKLLNSQISKISELIDNLDSKIQNEQNKLCSLESGDNSQHNAIERKYAENNIDRFTSQKKKIDYKRRALKGCLTSFKKKHGLFCEEEPMPIPFENDGEFGNNTENKIDVEPLNPEEGMSYNPNEQTKRIQKALGRKIKVKKVK